MVSRHDQLEKVVQETADSCFEKIGFKRDGVPYHPFRNVTLATLDWDARVRPSILIKCSILIW